MVHKSFVTTIPEVGGGQYFSSGLWPPWEEMKVNLLLKSMGKKAAVSFVYSFKGHLSIELLLC